MPVYEYFWPRCTRRLEVLRPTYMPSEYSDCPHCGGKAWRLVSGFGSKTVFYLHPSGTPFKTAPGSEPASAAEPETQTSGQTTCGPTGPWLPTSYFGWFLLLAACTAVIVVPLVWIMAMAAQAIAAHSHSTLSSTQAFPPF